MKILSIVGARPNFMKISPFVDAINVYNNKSHHPIHHILIHTGQHYDHNMSEKFFKTLNIPEPDINLGIGSGSHAEQVGKTMIEFEKIVKETQPDWVVVVGDVNATLAASVTAKKENIKCAHIEAGLRAKDLSMPEEINRLVTDRLSDLLFTPDRISTMNLIQEGTPLEKIKFVGNIMIDTLDNNITKAQSLKIQDIIRNNLINGFDHNRNVDDIGLLTIHRPSNVDDKIILEKLIDFLCTEVAKELFLIWPIHPRTATRLKEYSLWEKVMNNDKIILLNPVGYLEMLKLNDLAKIVFTDSGGLQEECTVLGTPCLTLRWNTERPITLKKFGGASILVGNNINNIKKEFYEVINDRYEPFRPELWDGKAADRILKELLNYSK